MRQFKFLLVALLMLMFFAVQAGAWQVTDIYSNDDNVITGQDSNQTLNELIIWEDYNEDNLVPYPSHDGFGVVNKFPDPGCPSGICWFDKVFTKDTGDNGSWLFDFRVDNTTEWDWSDYHFEFWDDTFTNRLDNVPLTMWGNEVVFMNDNFDGSTLEFWAPNYHNSDQEKRYYFQINSDDMPDSFGIRQVATTPEPVSSILFATGGALFAGRRYWKKRRKR